VRARLSERDQLDLPARRAALESALADAGFDVEACAPALEAFAHPSPELGPAAVPNGDLAPSDGFRWLLARHLGHDGADALVATYVRPATDSHSADRLRRAILAADPASAITGFDAIDRVLREVLARDLLLVGSVALALVGVAMLLALRSARQALIALATLACEMGLVGIAMRALAVRWHVYDALVVPVLFGVTIDESMFLLHASADQPLEAALRAQGPLVAATALTTAAGFAALMSCRYDGLRDLGMVGAIGVIAGLIASLVVVPCALTLLAKKRA
jgi:predicted exporter